MAQTPCKARQVGDTIPYTPGSAKLAGDVVVLGTTLVTIATHDIAASTLGAVSIRGVYEGPKDNSDISSVGLALYWDADGNPVGGTAGSGALTTNSALGPFAGYSIETAGTGVGVVDFVLKSVDSSNVSAAFATGTVAATGTVQANAAELASGLNVVTAADGTKGVKLPSAVAGMVVVVVNNADNVLKVWPNTSDAINAIAANTNYNMTNLSSAIFISLDATTWSTIPKVAS